MNHSISQLNLFPTYATREDFQAATLEEAPPWNPYRFPKNWFDPNAKTNPSRVIVYEHAFAVDANTGQVLENPDGTPKFDKLALSRDEAATVNIPPTGPGQTDVPGADQTPVPVPMRALAPNEVIVPGFGNVPELWTTDELQEKDPYSAILKYLRAIANKLGV